MSDVTKVYHYCSPQSFKAIIETKSLWLTNTSTMNDTMEGIWYKNILIEELEKNIIKGKNEQLINNLYNTVVHNLTNKFICCFSEYGDILSQWRAYADDGRGFAVGFSVEKTQILQKIPSWMAVNDSKHSIGIAPVIYDRERQKELIANQVSDIISKNSNLPPEKTTLLSQYSTIFKNPAFSEEKEWRIIHTPLITYDKNYSFSVIGKISDCNFRLSKFGVSPYFTWNFKELDPLPIEEIILGPQNTTPPEDLLFFLSHNGYQNITIKFSAASYRS